MVRTPELIAEVIRALPSPPARRIVLGGAMDDGKEDPVALALSRRGIHGDNTLDPYFNLFMFHRLANDEEWVRAWMDVPLNLHDAGFVAAIDSLVRWRPEKSRRYMDVSQEMSRALEMHPGPVSCLRVDASEFPPPDRLRRWIELLSAKNVQELILLNLTGPEETEAPLHDLRSSRLTKLTVGFLSLRDSLRLAFEAAAIDGHAWCFLTDLTLTACAFDGPYLSHTVSDLQGLKNLCLRSCSLTDGCNQQFLSIASRGLVSIHLWCCTADRKIIFGEAPALTRLTLGVLHPAATSPNLSQAPASPPPLGLEIKFCSSLCNLDHLDLQRQDFDIWSCHRVRVRIKCLLIFCYL